jgi:peptidoglycan/xylan/chitin deacetylase (PgdA/CDA1 family)/sulfur carrier protein ThiS
MAVRTFPGRASAIALGVAVLAFACGGSSPPPPSTPPPVHVLVDGIGHDLPPATTLGTLIEDLHLRASAGSLLSVSGAVIDRHAYPGRIVVNGHRVSLRTELRRGDRIEVANGNDRTEGTRTVVVQVDEPRVGNPELTLKTYRMRQVTVTGRFSGEIVSIEDIPLGSGHAPRSVALTFDDGPWPGDTQRIMAVLHHYRVPATFFMVGNLVERYPGLARKVADAGYPIGNHSFDHPVAPALADLDTDRIIAEMADTTNALEAAGIVPTLFRPPGGSYDDFVVQEARRQDMRVVLWNIDPNDWRAGLKAKQVAKRVLRQVRAGSIILLHDGGGDAAHTIKALPAIIRGIRAMGLSFTTVPALPRVA